jgi:hypothetical protein
MPFPPVEGRITVLLPAGASSPQGQKRHGDTSYRVAADWASMPEDRHQLPEWRGGPQAIPGARGFSSCYIVV